MFGIDCQSSVFRLALVAMESDLADLFVLVQGEGVAEAGLLVVIVGTKVHTDGFADDVCNFGFNTNTGNIPVFLNLDLGWKSKYCIAYLFFNTNHFIFYTVYLRLIFIPINNNPVWQGILI